MVLKFGRANPRNLFLQLRQGGAACEAILEGGIRVGHRGENAVGFPGATRPLECAEGGHGGRVGDKTVGDQSLVQIGEHTEAAANDGGLGNPQAKPVRASGTIGSMLGKRA